MQADEDLAARRYWALQLIRLSGAALVLVGASILAGNIDAPQIAGAGLLVLGAVDFFAMPWFLARKWKRGA